MACLSASEEVFKEVYFCANEETGLGDSIWYIAFFQNVFAK